MGIPQWSNVWDSTLPAEATSSNPGRGTKIPQASWFNQKTNKQTKKTFFFLLSAGNSPLGK